jgi:hypothetical protein
MQASTDQAPRLLPQRQCSVLVVECKELKLYIENLIIAVTFHVATVRESE